MSCPLPPDPYLVLGLSKDADAATIRSTYRKLAFKCHPDKVADESLKQQKQEEFHKIQQAYELIGDEEKRREYDALVRLEQNRKESQKSRPDVKPSHYETRTAAPAGATPFKENAGPRFEQRKPASHPYDEHDRYFDQRARSKYDTYEAYPRTSRSSRPEKEPVRVTKTSDRTRSERTKTRDREERRERAGKFVIIEDDTSSNDEKARYESEYRRRSDEDAAKKAAEQARLKAEMRRSYEEDREPRRHRSGEGEYDRQRKLTELEHDAVRYIHRSKADIESRPSPSRTTSRDPRPDPYESRSSRRPEPVRRSSAPRRERPSSSGRDSHRDRKGIPEIVDWDDRKAPPPFKHSSSSPAEIHVPPRVTPKRAQTEAYDAHRLDKSPPPMFRRSETMPVHSSSRRKETTVPRSSGLRSSETAAARESEYPTIPAARTSSTTTKYYYNPQEGGVRLHPDGVGVANGHRTILREPDRHRPRSPSPLTRPPIGANRPMDSGSSRHTSSAIPPPPLGRSATSVREDDRGRSQRLYGEISSGYTERDKARRQNSFSPGSVSYSPKIGPEDISWSSSRRRDDRDYKPMPKPTFGRTSTYVY
jgi:curved DNA-binding protein CbpA